MAAAVTGLLAALTVLGVGHLVAALIDPAASPFYALGAAVVDHTPHAVKDAAIRRFGSNDKLALFASMGAVMLVAAPLLGLVERRRPLLVLLGGLTLEAALQRPTATWWFALPTLAGVVAGVGVMRLLIGRIGERGEYGRASTPGWRIAAPVSHLGCGCGGAGGGGNCCGAVGGACLRDVVADRARFVVPRAGKAAPAAGAGVGPAVPGLTEFVTAPASPATPGTHTLRVRATDRSGARQTDHRAPPFPDGASGWHSRVITVR